MPQIARVSCCFFWCRIPGGRWPIRARTRCGRPGPGNRRSRRRVDSNPKTMPTGTAAMRMSRPTPVCCRTALHLLGLSELETGEFGRGGYLDVHHAHNVCGQWRLVGRGDAGGGCSGPGLSVVSSASRPARTVVHTVRSAAHTVRNASVVVAVFPVRAPDSQRLSGALERGRRASSSATGCAGWRPRRIKHRRPWC